MENFSAHIPNKLLDELGRALALYSQGTGKDLAEVTNRGLRQLAIFASSKTPAADIARIDAELSRVVAYQVFSKGKAFKRLKKPKAIKKRSRLANNIIWARAHEKGEKITSDEAEKRARAMIAGRKAAVKFIRSGYLPALVATKAKRAQAGRQRGKPKGVAELATPARITAMLSNQVQGREGGAAVKVGRAALLQSIPEVERDMRQYAEKKIAERTARANRAR